MYDDFDTQITPEELGNPDDQFETCNRLDAPDDWEEQERQWKYMNGEYPDDDMDGSHMVGGGCPFDEGSDRDNWEDNQVFMDNEW